MNEDKREFIRSVLVNTLTGQAFVNMFSPARFLINEEDDELYWDTQQGENIKIKDMSEDKFLDLIEKSVEQKKNLFLDYLDKNL